MSSSTTKREGGIGLASPAEKPLSKLPMTLSVAGKAIVGLPSRVFQQKPTLSLRYDPVVKRSQARTIVRAAQNTSVIWHWVGGRPLSLVDRVTGDTEAEVDTQSTDFRQAALSVLASAPRRSLHSSAAPRAGVWLDDPID
jgi:hypothetical protein